MTPAWIPGAFAALMLAVAAVSAARLIAVRPWQRGPVATGIDLAHLFMGIAMAGMLKPGLTTLPGGEWDVIFGLLAGWFAYLVMLDARENGLRALAVRHCAPHLVHSAAMLYMFGFLTAPAAGMGGASGAAMHSLRYPVLAFVFALILAGYTVWDLDQLSSGNYRLASVPGGAAVVAFSGAHGMPRTGTAVRVFPLSAGTTIGCRIAMGVTMIFMLLIMI